MSFLFVCGGTAGHINPALAIASRLQSIRPDARILFVGAGKSLERKLIPGAGFHLVNIRMGGLRRDFSPDSFVYNMNTVRYLSTAGVKARELIGRFSPDAVIGTGGYICYPILRKASQMGIPTLVHESNAVPGLTTKLLSASADMVLTSFQGLERLYRRPERVIFTGTPIRGGFAAASAGCGTAVSNEKPLIVSFWGSLGAERMNETMTDLIRINAKTMLFDHIHAAGKNGGVTIMKHRLRQAGGPEELPPGIEIREYIDDMQSVMAKADIVICRAGGSTIAEVAVSGKPAILIPSPYVTNNQQVENAKQVQKAGGAVLIQEKDCTGEVLYDVISLLLADREKLGRMSAAQRAMGVPDAAERIARLILEICDQAGGARA